MAEPRRKVPVIRFNRTETADEQRIRAARQAMFVEILKDALDG